MHQEAGLQPLVGGERLVVVAASAVRGDPGLQSAEPQLQEETAGRKARPSKEPPVESSQPLGEIFIFISAEQKVKVSVLHC